jgi:hypothetical protein
VPVFGRVRTKCVFPARRKARVYEMSGASQPVAVHVGSAAATRRWPVSVGVRAVPATPASVQARTGTRMKRLMVHLYPLFDISN